MPARGIWNIHTFTWHAFALVDEFARAVSLVYAGDRGSCISHTVCVYVDMENRDREIFHGCRTSHGFGTGLPSNCHCSTGGSADTDGGRSAWRWADECCLRTGQRADETRLRRRRGGADVCAPDAPTTGDSVLAAAVGLAAATNSARFDRHEFRNPSQMAKCSYLAAVPEPSLLAGDMKCPNFVQFDPWRCSS